MKKILIIGSSGQLGSDLTKEFEDSSGIEVITLDHSLENYLSLRT